MKRLIENSRAWALIGLGVFLSIAEPSYATTITVINLDGAGEGFNDPGAPDPDSTAGGNTEATLGAQRLRAFQFAADLWEAQLSSSVETKVGANFNPLTCSATSAILGSAGPNTVHRDFTGAPVAATWYVQALANARNGSDLDPTENDIGAQFNSSIGTTCAFPNVWYYGLDGSPPGSKIDFVTVVLHELAHGLGFLSLVDLGTGAKLAGFDDAYMRLLEDHSTAKLFPIMTNGERFTASRDAPDLHWTGTEAIACGTSALTSGRHSSGHIEMFAPSTAQPGSSVSHWNTTLFPNQLMEPSYTGPLLDLDVLVDPCLLVDLGWTVPTTTTTTTTLPTTTTTTTLPTGTTTTTLPTGTTTTTLPTGTTTTTLPTGTTTTTLRPTTTTTTLRPTTTTTTVRPPQQVTCNGLRATIVGNNNNNIINGTQGDDVIHGLGGNDTIRGRGGNDTICGGIGRDSLFGNGGRDTLKGNSGNDTMNGGPGSDRCNGGPGTDTATSCARTISVP